MINNKIDNKIDNKTDNKKANNKNLSYYSYRSPQDKFSFIASKRAIHFAIGLTVLTFVLLLASLMLGNYPLSVKEVLDILFSSEAKEDISQTVVWDFRFPRVLTAIFVGMLLALSGAILQNVTRNPLADPSLVGVSQGASMAVVTLVIVYPEVSSAFRPLIAFLGAGLVGALILTLSAKKKAGSQIRFILTGIGIAAFISSITMTLLTYGNIYKVMTAMTWLAGSLHSTGWFEVEYLALALLVFIPLLIYLVRPLAALRMGEEVAVSLGVKIKSLTLILIVISIAMAAITVAAVGALGFVALLAPHLARKMANCGVSLHLVLSSLAGGLLVGSADLLGRSLSSSIQVPAGIITALLGVPLFISLIVKNANREL